MNKKNQEHVAAMIAQVESGNKWGCYTAPFTNSKREKTITIGAFQFGGGSNEARDLLRIILRDYPDVFRAIDSTGIEAELKKDWYAECWDATAAQKRQIIAIITTDGGIQSQIKYFCDIELPEYLKHAAAFGIEKTQLQALWVEIEHLAGLSGAKRIFGRLDSQTVEAVDRSLKMDQADHSSENQAGDTLYYKDRHTYCLDYVKKYIEEETEGNSMAEYTAAAVIAEAKKWEGYLEKAGSGTDEQLRNKTWNPGSANITWFWRWLERSGCLSGLQGQAWCDAFNDFIHATVAGVEEAAESLNGYSAYTPDSAARYKAAGRWISRTGEPKPGDQIFFQGYVSYENENTYRIKHTGIVTAVTVDRVYTIEGNTSSAPGVVANGGCVRCKDYDRRDGAIAGYGRPLYVGTKEETAGKTPKVENGWCYKFRPAAVSYGSASASVLLLQEILKARGLYNGPLDWKCGNGTVAAINDYQTRRRAAGVELGTDGHNDGVCGPRMWADLLALPQDDEGYFYVYKVSYAVKSTSVLLLQEIMTARGYYSGGLDWECGRGTVAAINRYQNLRRAAGVELGTDGRNDSQAFGKVFADLISID